MRPSTRNNLHKLTRSLLRLHGIKWVIIRHLGINVNDHVIVLVKSSLTKLGLHFAHYKLDTMYHLHEGIDGYNGYYINGVDRNAKHVLISRRAGIKLSRHFQFITARLFGLAGLRHYGSHSDFYVFLLPWPWKSEARLIRSPDSSHHW